MLIGVHQNADAVIIPFAPTLQRKPQGRGTSIAPAVLRP